VDWLTDKPVSIIFLTGTIHKMYIMCVTYLFGVMASKLCKDEVRRSKLLIMVVTNEKLQRRRRESVNRPLSLSIPLSVSQRSVNS
jgi:hypothetical protein